MSSANSTTTNSDDICLQSTIDSIISSSTSSTRFYHMTYFNTFSCGKYFYTNYVMIIYIILNILLLAIMIIYYASNESKNDKKNQINDEDINQIKTIKKNILKEKYQYYTDENINKKIYYDERISLPKYSSKTKKKDNIFDIVKSAYKNNMVLRNNIVFSVVDGEQAKNLAEVKEEYWKIMNTINDKEDEIQRKKNAVDHLKRKADTIMKGIDNIKKDKGDKLLFISAKDNNENSNEINDIEISKEKTESNENLVNKNSNSPKKDKEIKLEILDLEDKDDYQDIYDNINFINRGQAILDIEKLEKQNKIIMDFNSVTERRKIGNLTNSRDPVIYQVAIDPELNDIKIEEIEEEYIEPSKLTFGEFLKKNLIERHILLSPFFRNSIINPGNRKIMLLIVYINLIFLIFVLIYSINSYSTGDSIDKNSGITFYLIIIFSIVTIIFTNLIIYFFCYLFSLTINEKSEIIDKIDSRSVELEIFTLWNKLKDQGKSKNIIGYILSLVIIILTFLFLFTFTAIFYGWKLSMILSFFISILFDFIIFDPLFEIIISYSTYEIYKKNESELK